MKGLAILSKGTCSAVLAALILTHHADAGDGVESKTVRRIDLATALRLAGAQNLDVQIARERVAEAEAAQLQAIESFFPTLSPGVSYRRHENNLQTVEGRIINADKELYSAGGSVLVQADIGEAIFRALAAKQLKDAAKFAAGAQRQESVLQSALAYFDLARGQAAAAVAAESVEIAQDYSTQVSRAAEVGLAFKGDVFRTTAQAERNRLTLSQVKEQQRLAAARLAEVLHLDPAVELRPASGELVPIHVVPLSRSLDSLVADATGGRPELKQYAAQLEAARKNRQGAIYGPLIPTVNGQVFYGGLGGGVGSPGPQDFGQSSDYAAGLSWKVGPGGLFDLGRMRANDARVRIGKLELEKSREVVLREVVEGFTRIHSLSAQIEDARRALAASEQSLKLSRERVEFGVAEVLESIQAEQDLTRARLDYVGIVAEQNKAQYLLQRARGALGTGDDGKKAAGK